MKVNIDIRPMGNKTNSINIFRAALRFPKEVKNKPFIDFLVFINILINLEYESASKLIIGIFPSRSDSFPKIINRTDVPGTAIDIEARISIKLLG